ncbi:MAG: TonB-dependent receptor [Bacteroidetes bacterium]|nr:TonB-dependent receptor [Bacteroidota bacterium]
MDREVPSTHYKALQINLDPTSYGTIAEIGGGQEVARHFFQAGAASGTVGKTISAYDMAFSDTVYGKNPEGRYVSLSRLEQMLTREFRETVDILQPIRKAGTRFFAFANTVSTINFKKDNEGHGWMGIHFQLFPQQENNEVVLHVRLLENDALLQQATLGILGVNLIYACYYHHTTPNTFLLSLMDNLSRDRLEITMIRMKGPQLDYVDNRLLSVQLVKNGMAQASMFDRHGRVQQPADMLYKKDVLAFRGSFRPITYVGFDMLKTSFALFKKEAEFDKLRTVALCEMTLSNLLAEGQFDERDFLDRVDLLNGMGQNVMISNFREYYKLVRYLSQFRTRNLRVVMGLPTFINIMDKSFYADLRGGILEAFGKLFPENMKIYLYPALSKDGLEILTLENVAVPEEIHYLIKHLIVNQKIVDIPGIKKKWLTIFSHEVLKKIQQKDPDWEKMVPVYVAQQIRTKRLFGFHGDE